MHLTHGRSLCHNIIYPKYLCTVLNTCECGHKCSIRPHRATNLDQLSTMLFEVRHIGEGQRNDTRLNVISLFRLRLYVSSSAPCQALHIQARQGTVKNSNYFSALIHFRYVQTYDLGSVNHASTVFTTRDSAAHVFRERCPTIRGKR